ncbi:hypothetical protein CC1G_00336 [Coprinopsis cinerea okayama7|uniref:Uncharacterized protein n=1 Tax=Coprinopsis cinerea (strain Okayama-7 / 130 / ATCC MYA-4618 / FGSC 9003) TaxID=240176 RepID=A8NXL2_COPC7|nr:hypothetical protein CC1G_00336 [Coprinopsis cinerea okayama7\|eukprot:XP_001837200.2 hypothetical protein CC1G_00336 [Coprinopsis cinerea okayama7\
MNPFDLPDATYQPPPPAYSEQEFDQKVSTALSLSREAHGNVRPAADDDEWEPYDPAAFEAAAAAYESKQKKQAIEATPQQLAGPSAAPTFSSQHHPQASSSSQPAPTQPLRIHKKNGPSQDLKATPEKKNEPKWIASEQPTTSASSNPSNQPYNPYDGDDIAPPPFMETAPEISLHPQSNGEEFDPYTLFPSSPSPSSIQRPPSRPRPDVTAIANECNATSAHQYNRSTFTASGPPSAYRQSMPASPTTPPAHREHRPHSEISPRTTANSTHFMAQSPDDPNRATQQPRTFSSSGSFLNFNPSIAYGKSPPRQPQFTPMQGPQETPVFSAAAFYNAAVSAHMQYTPRTSGRATGGIVPTTAASYGPLPGSNHISPQPLSNGRINGWSSSNRPMSVVSMESYYSDQNDAQLGQYCMNSIPPSVNNNWQHYQR